MLIRLCMFESEYKILVSSANKINLRSFDTLQMSLIYKIKSLGPSTEPCVHHMRFVLHQMNIHLC